MSTNNIDTKRYYVRRVTKELIASLLPANEYPAAQELSGFWRFAAKIGDAFKDLLGGALSKDKPDGISKYSGAKAGSKIQTLYGYFIVVIFQGKIQVFTDPGRIAPPVGAEVFLVADLVGLPLARVTGQIEKSFLDTTPGETSQVQYAINLWLDPGLSAWSTTDLSEQEEREAQQRIGRFLQTFMAGRNDLTIDEFCQLASIQLSPIIQTTLALPRLKEQEVRDIAIRDFSDAACRLIGVTSEVFIRPSSQIFRHQITLDETTLKDAGEFTVPASDYLVYTDDGRAWKCPSCKTENDLSGAFCGNCGQAKPSALKEVNQNQQSRRLISADGDQLVFDLSFVSYDKPSVDTDSIAIKCIEVLRPIARKFPLTSFSDPIVLTNIANLLNQQFGTGVHGSIGEFSIIDFRSADSDWQLQTRAKIKEQLRDINASHAEIEVAEAFIALREAQLVVEKKNRQTRERELQETIESRKLDLDHDLESTKLDSRHEVEKMRVDINKDLDQDKILRDAERERRKLDREDVLDATQSERSDQIADLSHQMEMEKQVLRHDIGKEQALDDAKRLKEDKDLSFEERAARLRAARGIDIARQEQDLGLDKATKEQELRLQELKLREDLKLRELQALGEISLAKREQYKGMSAAQIMAMQASKLAKNGANDALESLASKDADAEAKLAAEKAALYERMLQMQSDSTDRMLNAKESSEKSQLDLMKAMLGAQQDSNEKVLKAHEKTADNAEKWNEKSIDAMAKVASTAAGKGGKADKSSKDDEVECQACGKSVPDGKFCAKCGSPLGD